MRNRDTIGILVGFGAAVLLFGVIFALRRGAPVPVSPEPAPPVVVQPPPAKASEKASAKAPDKPGATPSAPAKPAPVAAAPAAPVDVTAAAAEWKPKPEAEFTKADVERGPATVTVDLGDYQAKAGEEFEVVIAMTAPALEDSVFVIEYDPEVLEPVAKSAKPLGAGGLRHGLEFYITPAKKRLVILSSGNPSMKKVDAMTGGPVVSFRVKVKDGAKGQTSLVAAENMCFTSGRGERLPQQVSGGLVTIAE